MIIFVFRIIGNIVDNLDFFGQINDITLVFQLNFKKCFIIPKFKYVKFTILSLVQKAIPELVNCTLFGVGGFHQLVVFVFGNNALAFLTAGRAYANFERLKIGIISVRTSFSYAVGAE